MDELGGGVRGDWGGAVGSPETGSYLGGILGYTSSGS